MDEIHGWKECPGPHCRLILLHVTLFLHTITCVTRSKIITTLILLHITFLLTIIYVSQGARL